MKGAQSRPSWWFFMWLEYTLPITDVQHKIIPKSSRWKKGKWKGNHLCAFILGECTMFQKKIVMGLSKWLFQKKTKKKKNWVQLPPSPMFLPFAYLICFSWQEGIQELDVPFEVHLLRWFFCLLGRRSCPFVLYIPPFLGALIYSWLAGFHHFSGQ